MTRRHGDYHSAALRKFAITATSTDPSRESRTKSKALDPADETESQPRRPIQPERRRKSEHYSRLSNAGGVRQDGQDYR